MIFEAGGREVQQQGTATSPTSSSRSRPAKTFDLRQRPSSTVMQLVHTEVVTRDPWSLGIGDEYQAVVRLWCGACSAEDHRDIIFCEPPHELGRNGPPIGWLMGPDA
jgi:hypothetical protein